MCSPEARSPQESPVKVTDKGRGNVEVLMLVC